MRMHLLPNYFVNIDRMELSGFGAMGKLDFRKLQNTAIDQTAPREISFNNNLI